MQVIESLKSALSAYAGDDVRSLLHSDHIAIRDLTKALVDAERASSRKAVIKKLKPLLVAHSRAEEEAVYKALMTLSEPVDTRIAGNEGMVEHNLCSIVLERLAATPDASTDMWRAHAKVLHELLEHHIKEEEDDVFSELGKHFSDEQRKAMASVFLAGRNELLGIKLARAKSSQFLPPQPGKTSAE